MSPSGSKTLLESGLSIRVCFTAGAGSSTRRIQVAANASHSVRTGTRGALPVPGRRVLSRADRGTVLLVRGIPYYQMRSSFQRRCFPHPDALACTVLIRVQRRPPANIVCTTRGDACPPNSEGGGIIPSNIWRFFQH